MLAQPEFELTDVDVITEIIRARGWATLVSAPAHAKPVISYLPVILEPPDGGTVDRSITVLGHLAKVDAEEHQLGACPIAISIAGPESYVSAAWYPTGVFVPTWNYVAVHLHGVPELLDAEETSTVLDRTVEHFENLQGTNWSLEASREYADSLVRYVTGFRLVPERVVAKAKLSQDKDNEQIRGVISGLERSATPNAQAVASWMRRIALPPSA